MLQAYILVVTIILGEYSDRYQLGWYPSLFSCETVKQSTYMNLYRHLGDDTRWELSCERD